MRPSNHPARPTVERRWPLPLGGLLAVALVIGVGGYAGWGALARTAGEPRRSPTVPPGGTETTEVAAAGRRPHREPAKHHLGADAVPPPANGAPLADPASASEDPVAAEAALLAIEAGYSSRAARGEPFDAEADRTVVRHLGSAQPIVVARALRAASVPMVAGRPSDELVTAVSELARPSAPAERRQAALEALTSLRPSLRSTSWLERFEAALRAPEPPVLATALEALQSSPRLWQLHAEAVERFVPLVNALVAHPDPGVRGRALALLALLDGGGRDTRVRVRAALGDPHPYVRAVACDALGATEDAAHVHDLMPLVSDLAEARYDLTGWTRLDGQPGHLLHAVPGRRCVAEAALYAVETLADGAVRLPFGGREAPQAQLRESIQRALAWYATARTRLPPQLP